MKYNTFCQTTDRTSFQTIRLFLPGLLPTTTSHSVIFVSNFTLHLSALNIAMTKITFVNYKPKHIIINRLTTLIAPHIISSLRFIKDICTPKKKSLNTQRPSTFPGL